MVTIINLSLFLCFLQVFEETKRQEIYYQYFYFLVSIIIKMESNHVVKCLSPMRATDEQFYKNLTQIVSYVSLEYLEKVQSLVSHKLSQSLSMWKKNKDFQVHQSYLPRVLNILFTRMNQQDNKKYELPLINIVLDKFTLLSNRSLKVVSLVDTQSLEPSQNIMIKNLTSIVNPGSEKQIENINRMIKSLTQFKCLYPDACLACSQYFYDHWILGDKFILIGLVDFQKQEFKQTLKRKMKDKGGIILVNPFAEEERMMGAIYSRSEKQRIQKRVKKCEQFVNKKGFQIELHLVRVYQDPSLQKNAKTFKKANQEQRLIPRIIIRVKPYKSKQKIQKANQENSFTNKKIWCTQANTFTYLQQRKQKSFSKEKRYFRYNHTIICVSKLKNPMAFDFQRGFPRIQKKYQTFLVLRFEKQKELVDKFFKALDLNQIDYTKMIPFPVTNSQKNTILYVIDHDVPFSVLNKFKEEVDQQDRMLLFIITNNLQLQGNYNPIKMKLFTQSFQKHFQQIYYIKQKITKLKEYNYVKKSLVFKRKQHAIFAFVYFEQYWIKAAFVKDKYI